MYKFATRAVIRWSIGCLNRGEIESLLRLAASDAELAFPGDNSYAHMFRQSQPSRRAFVTHRGTDELRAFAQRVVDNRVTFVIEDILVNGPPWRTRVAVRLHNFIDGVDGDEYNNRFVAFIEIRWGRIHRWEDFEDTQRVAKWDDDRARRGQLERRRDDIVD